MSRTVESLRVKKLFERKTPVTISMPPETYEALRGLLFREGNLPMSSIFVEFAERLVMEDPYLMSFVKDLRYKRAMEGLPDGKRASAHDLEDLYLIIEQSSPFAKPGEER